MSVSFGGVRARTLRVSSPAIPVFLGHPALEPVRLSGQEGVSSLFTYELLLKTPDGLNLGASGAADFDLDAFIGREIQCSIELDGSGALLPGAVGASVDRVGAGVRVVNALITEASLWGEEGRHVQYKLTLRPWLHLATLSSNCRIFQNQSAVEILDSLLADYAFPVDKRLIESYPARDYQTQFNESDFEFFSRLCQEWGISYFFEHEGDAHRLVLVDAMGAYLPVRAVADGEVVFAQSHPERDFEYNLYTEASFTNLPAEFLKADWRFHPREFVEVMRTCGWLSENEAKQLFPKTALRDARPTGWVNEAVSPSTGNLSAHLTQLNKTMRKYCITTPQRMATFWGNVMQETQWFRLLAEGGGSSTRYAPWYGRGFLQLTWPANYIKYARFKGISVSAQLESRLVSAQQTANNARNSSALRTLEGSMPANLISLRDAVESSQGRPMEPSDSAGVYWAWSAANQSADPAAAFARTTVDGLTYYTHSSFGNVAATVNVGRPSTDYTRINGVQARFQAYTTAVMVLLEGELFPDAQGKMQETPEGWNKRLP